jgi:hypothetical protein
MSRTRNPRIFNFAVSVFFATVLLLVAFALSGTGRPDALAAQGPAGAGVSAQKSGGLVVPGKPTITDVVCVRRCVASRKATPGATVRVVGRYLNRVRHVVFNGRKTPLRARYSARNFRVVSVVVPRLADDGRPFVVSAAGSRSNRAPRQLEILPVSRIPREVFPVRGTYNFGSSGASFGAGRSGYAHQGQDVMASCGTRLVSIRRARVIYNKYHSAAGNYVVLQNLGTNTQFAYMHLLRRSPLRVGQLVGAGQPIGLVGQTGRAYGCHLHFEYWVGRWQLGGRPINPLPYVRSLR